MPTPRYRPQGDCVKSIIWLTLLLPDWLAPFIDLFHRGEFCGDCGYRCWERKAGSRRFPTQEDKQWLNGLFILKYIVYIYSAWDIYSLGWFWASSYSSEIYIYGSGYSCSLSLSSFKSGSYGYGSLRISVPGIYLSIWLKWGPYMSNTHWVFGPTGGLSLLWRRIILLLSWRAWTELHRVHIRADLCLHGYEGGTHLGSLVTSYAQLSGHWHFIYWPRMATTVDANLGSMPNAVKFRLLRMTRTGSSVSRTLTEYWTHGWDNRSYAGKGLRDAHWGIYIEENRVQLKDIGLMMWARTCFSSSTSTWHSFSYVRPDTWRIGKFNKDMQLNLYSPEYLGLHKDIYPRSARRDAPLYEVDSPFCCCSHSTLWSRTIRR